MIIVTNSNIPKYHKAYRASEEVLIATYSFNRDYVAEILTNVRVPTYLFISMDFYREAVRLNNEIKNTDVHIALHPETHVKLFVIDEEVAHVSTSNFTRTSWFEIDVAITDRLEVKKLRRFFFSMWNDSETVRLNSYFPRRKK